MFLSMIKGLRGGSSNNMSVIDTAAMCRIHSELEPIDDDTFLVCRDCCHAFQTKEKLLEACWEKFGETIQIFDADKVSICPYCLYDIQEIL